MGVMITISELIYDFQRKIPEATIDTKRFMLGLNVSTVFMGDAWVQSRLIDKNSKEKYFPYLVEGKDNIAKFYDRVTTLGECLYNLQRVDGFVNVLNKLRTAKLLEPFIAELEVGKFLFRHGINLRFIHESGKIGSDYDIHVTTDSKHEFACEITCKLETATLEKNTILNALHKKAKQAKDIQKIIIIKIPEKWLSNTSLKAAVERSLVEIFRNKKSIGGIIFIWEQWLNNHTARAFMYQPHINEQCRYDIGGIKETVTKLNVKNIIRWVKFEDEIKSVLETTVRL